MSRRRCRRHDRHLAAAFCTNARSFHDMARATRERAGGASAYYSAIAVDLGLKAYLLHHGITDHWNRIHIRHDLAKALKCARRAGLKDIPGRLSELAELLGPLYVFGALRDLIECPIPLPPDAIDEAVGGLIDSAQAIIDCARRSDG